MKIRTILILTLMISTATCQDETDRKQERGVINNAVGLSIGVIFGIVFGIVFVVCCIAMQLTTKTMEYFMVAI
jgi:hypothetical protein